MSYKSLESIIRSVVSDSTLEEAALGDHKGLVALAKRKTGDEKDTMMRAAEMMKKGQVKDLNMFMKAMDQSTHKAIMPYVDKKHYKALHEEEIDEKTLTPAELKKREEIAKAIERENPNMPMPQKMAIATAQAKKVAEDREDKVLDFLQSLSEEVQINEAVDDEGKMARGQLMRMAKQAAALGNMMSDDKQLDGWVQSKLTKASDYLDSVHDYLMNNKQDVDEEVIDESNKFTDKQVKMAYGVLNDPRYKRGNLTGAANAIEKIAKGLTKHPGVKKAMYATQEQVDKTKKYTKPTAAEIKKDKEREAGKSDRMYGAMRGGLKEARGGADEPDKHIIMQLRSAQDLGGKRDITFRGGHKAQVDKKHIDKILKYHDHPSMKPDHKRLLRVIISKGPKHLSSFANRLKEDFNIEDIDTILQETKGAPKGYHFTRSGQLKKGDAGQDGPGGAMLRADPLDKVRKKIPPLPEETDNAGKEVIHTRKADFKLSKVRLPDGRMVYRKVKKEVDIEK